MSHTPATRRQLRERDSSSNSSTGSSGSSSGSSTSTTTSSSGVGGGGGGGIAPVAKIRTRLSTGTLIMNGTSTIKEKDVRALSSSLAADSSKILTDAPVVGTKRRSSSTEAAGAVPPKHRKITTCDGSGRDLFCWLCHKDDSSVSCHCQLCPRSYHLRCLMMASIPKDWVCGECEKVMEAECMDTRSKAMKQISTDTLCLLLRYALERMCQPGSEVFQKPPSAAELPLYYDVIVNPMDFSTLEKNIKKKEYGCTDAFLADAKWILHNCIIYNGVHHKLTVVARNVVKSCKHEMTEIEVCPQCYKHSCINGEANWFTELCDPPHPLVWAKLKGYPFWPAKAMEEVGGGVDVRFFGAHDKSVVPMSHVFMLSEEPPTKMIKKRNELTSAIEEMEAHIEMIREKYGLFEYAPFRTPYDRGHVYMNNKLKGVNMKAAKRFKVAAHGRFAVKGKETEKVSAVAKTASAVKSKYSSLASKKSTPVTTPCPTVTTTPTKPVQHSDQSELQLPSSPDTAEEAIQKALSDCGRTSASKSRFINPVVSVTDIIQRKIHQQLELEKDVPGTSAESAESVGTVLTSKLEAPAESAEEKRAGTQTALKMEGGVEGGDKFAEGTTAEEQKETKQTLILEKNSKSESSAGRGTRGFTTAYVEMVAVRSKGEQLEMVDAAREAIHENKAEENVAEGSDKGNDKNVDVGIKKDDAGKDEEKSDVGTNLPKDHAEVERSVTDEHSEQMCVKRLPDSHADTKTEEKAGDSGQEKNKDSVNAPTKTTKDITNTDRPASELSKSSDVREAASSENVARYTPDSTSDQAEGALSAPQSPKSGSKVAMTTVSPQSGVEYRDSLLKTIEACKGKLGITDIEDVEVEEPMDVSDEEESIHTQEREVESEALAESQISTDSQDSRMNSELEVDPVLDSEMSSQKKTDSDNDSALDMSSVTSDLQGKSLDSEKDDTVSGLSETQSSSATERKETSQGSSEFEVSSVSNDVGNLPASLASGEDGDTGPTEDSDSSRMQVVGVSASERKRSDVGGKVLGTDVSDVCEKETAESSSSHSNSATHSVLQRSDSDATTNQKIAEASSVLDKAAEKWGEFVSKSKTSEDTASPERHKTLLNFSAQVTSSQNWESSSLRKEKTTASDAASTSSASKTSTGTPSGSSRVNPITINDDDDEPSLLMEVESIDKDEDELVIDLDGEDFDTEDSDSNEPCIIPRYRYKRTGHRKEAAPVPAAGKKKSKPASHSSLAKKQLGAKKKKKGGLPLNSPLPSSSNSSASSEPCEMMICDVRSLSGTQHAWKEDGKNEAPSSPTLSVTPEQTPPQQQRSQASEPSQQQRSQPSEPSQQQRSQPSEPSQQQHSQPSEPSQQQQAATPQQLKREQQRQQQQQKEQSAKPWYRAPRHEVLYQTLKQMQTRPPPAQQPAQEVLVRHVQEQLQHTIQQVQQSVQQLQEPQTGSQQPAAQQPAVQQQSPSPSAAAENAGQSLLLHHFRMPPTPPVEASQTGNTAASRSLHPSPSDAPGGNKDTSQGSHSGRSSAEHQLSDPGPPALTPAAVSLVNKYSQQIVGNMQLQLAEMSKELLASTVSEQGNQEERLKEEKEALQWKHEVQMAEVQHNHKLTVAEMKACWEAEMSKALADLKKKMAEEKEEAVIAAKKKQWCAHCWKEAMYYCCWNTSYCSYSCQQLHWTTHQISCRQILDTATTPQTTTSTATTPAAATATATAASTFMVASTSSSPGFVSLRPAVADKNVMVANDGVLTQAYKVQKPNANTVNVMAGGDMWRNRLQHNIQFFPTQPLPVSTTQAMKLLARPNQPMQPLPRFQYLSNLGPGSQPTFQPSPLIQVVGQRPLVNMNIPSSNMMFPLLPQQPPSSAVPAPTPTLHK